MNWLTVETGSSGNCFLFGDSVMIDCGVPFSKIEPYAQDLKYLLLTHEHGDHFKANTITKLTTVNQDLKIVCPSWMHEKAIGAVAKFNYVKSNIKKIELNKWYKAGEFFISAFNLYHDVQNCGYRLQLGEHKHLHATDTVTLDGITAKNYDSATIECNHCYDTAIELINKANERGEFSHLKRALRTHLSVQNALKFVEENNIKEFEPVHIGSSTKEQVLKKVEEYKNEN